MKLVISFTDYSRILNEFRIRIRDTHVCLHVKNLNETKNFMCLVIINFICSTAGNYIIEILYHLLLMVVKNQTEKVRTYFVCFK